MGTCHSAIQGRVFSQPLWGSPPGRQPRQLWEVARRWARGGATSRSPTPGTPWDPLGWAGGMVEGWEASLRARREGSRGQAPLLPWRPCAAAPRLWPCRCPAPRRSPAPLCRSRAWCGRCWASPSLRSFYVPGRAPAPRPGALLRVGGEETVKPTPGHPGLCHLALERCARSLPS